MHKILANLLMLIVVAGLGACQTPADDGQVGTKQTSSYSTVKPGAPVALEFDSDGEPTLGAPMAVTLAVTSASSADQLEISLTGDDGLEINPEQAMVQFSDVSPGIGQTHTVTVTPQRNGRLFINVFVTLDQGGQQSARTFAIPLQVGPEAVPQDDSQLEDEDGERIMRMPAEES